MKEKFGREGKIEKEGNKKMSGGKGGKRGGESREGRRDRASRG
jgi:hypothetical protein